MLRFSWDREKAASNLRKHGVSFGEARTVFGDTLALDIDDPTPSQDERRFVIMGISERERLLVVVYAEEDPETIRIISARPAQSRERRFYEHP
jgi:uncharacterized DUF497 family protein